MNKKQFTQLVERYKYIFIGEIHGTEAIPKITLKLIRSLSKNNKIMFFLEIPKQVEKEIYDYLNGKIKKQELLNSFYLRDAINDKRITNNILIMCKNLYKYNFIFKGLEDYKKGNAYMRDKDMAKRFLDIIAKNKVDKYILYTGNLHTLAKSIKIREFLVKPIKIYLPKSLIKRILTIQFNKSNKEKIGFNIKTNTINYNLISNFKKDLK